MRSRSPLAPIAALVLLALPLGLAPRNARAQGTDSVIACETLIAARRIDAASGSGGPAPSEAGCRRIPRGAIGTVEQRALIGGAPYECLTVSGGGPCLWIVP
ncbi:hypothetical protein ABID82_001915 [Methylobacterium sp. PvP062]|jgi:hypothetical protein|uniref:Uncharacterized protein n=2 Tax=Methylobacterium radiotolerans TaxID=31998 RepID=B1LWF9_METRJ|nr:MULTISPECIES: hypothetical protein [Methylobacterium]MCX7330452.1 hypothetical protein [Hyphomicrobiales bacterium]GAN47024.1 hypothetical protein ME121_1030 [Methylobacterium sp. ME121]ACB22661.1 hypothetical protein Mrad2831_0650 [Methylobacterium radiotolerans JCM 2831]KIU36911.1 hypothetical protein SR39_03540 [Methylobacterium radiotolerans]KTS08637.1 hypothetical protein SB3_13975 [Methylobacterium radiotolerans]